MRPVGSPEVADDYRRFAEEAADSPCFSEWALGIADDPEALDLLESLPPLKRQPNLVFAALRWHGATAPGPYELCRKLLLGEWSGVRETIFDRSTQTNEVGRLAVLTPVFAQVAREAQGPLGLIEVGASAGLCLYPDRWGYSWTLDGSDSTDSPESEVTLGAHPRLQARVTGSAPLPDAIPTVVWRAGIDLNPLDVRDSDAMAWLEQLVWPEHDARRERLRQAVDMARAEPPTLVAGDLLEELPALLEEVPDGVQPVVFHSAVIAYLDAAERDCFQRLMTDLLADGRCRWVSNEGSRVLPEITATLPAGAEDEGFVLGLDGQAVARAHGHGAWLRWLGGRPD